MSPEGHKTILVVNDSPDQLELLGEVLRKAGYRVLAAADGRRALAAAGENSPALVLSDVKMPGIGGIELCRRLRADARTRHTPCILASGHAKDAESVVEGFAAGADDYIELPFDPLKLVALVARHLERARVEAHYRLVVDNASDIIYTLDLAGRYTSVNRAAERLLGYTRDELLRMTWEQVVAPECVPLVREMIARKLAGEESVTFYEIVIVAKDGRRVHVEVSSQLLYEGGEAVGLQGIARDITERRLAEAAERERAEREAEAEKMRSLGQLSAGVAHNFNNALTAILGRTQLLLRTAGDEKQRHSLKVIETAALDAAEMVRRIQTFARRAPGRQLSRVSLAQLVGDAMQLARPRWEHDARAAGRAYEVRFARDLEGADEVEANPSELREVFVNLIFNALDAMPDGGRIHLRERRDGDWLVVEVEDDGPGIPPELQARIFEPFFTTKGPQGSGLGLAISYGVIKHHGGTIEVRSQPARGTTFTLRFPPAGAVPPAEQP